MGWAGPPSPEAFCGQGVRVWYHRDCQQWDSQDVEFREKQVGMCFVVPSSSTRHPPVGLVQPGGCRDGHRITILVFKSHHKH